MHKLDELVAEYGKRDAEIKTLKKITDAEKEQIKELLVQEKEDSWTSGGYTVQRVVSERETLNEERLLPILKDDWIKLHGSMECPYIKTKEYVDMDALETALYEGTIPQSTLAEMEKCREVTTVVALKCKKAKTEEN